jgi:GTP-binding protein EngB required for normal cell division/uncharacterized protein (DUF697 family)
MMIQVRKPILVGGISLSFLIWFWQIFQTSLTDLGSVTIVITMAFGLVLWALQRKSTTEISLTKKPVSLSEEKVKQAIAAIETLFTNLETEATNQDLSALKQEIKQLPEQLKRTKITIAIAGRQKVGKTTLKQLLETAITSETITLIEPEALLTENQLQDQQATASILGSDLVLLLTDSDLTDSELKILEQFHQLNHRIILIFNKQDRYLPEEKNLILQQINHRLKPLISETDIIAISANPNPVKVRQHQPDGTIQEWTEKPETTIKPLPEYLTKIITQETENLILATTWRETIKLKSLIKTEFNQIRKQRAIPLIEQYQWIAATTAFANPVASLDLLATLAINGQMIVDISQLYQQQFSLDQGKKASGVLGELMLKLGLVELSTQTISSILKSNTITYLAGGLLQGISAAYLTHIAGLSLIEYFQEQELNSTSGNALNLDSLKQKLQQIFQQNQRPVILQNFVKQAINRLSLSAKSPKLSHN